MSPPTSRRGFLRDLVGLPLVGGGLTLIGAPTAVAEPCTTPMLRRYVAFLAREYASAHDELLVAAPNDDRFCTFKGPVADLAFTNWPRSPSADAFVRGAPASTRAALLLSAAGCGWEVRQ